MDTAVVGLIGVLIGASAGLLGAYLTHRLNASREQKNRLRDRQADAYANSVRYLLRALNKRSKLTVEGQSVLGKDDIKEWFDDINEALVWLNTLTIYCSDEERPRIVDTLSQIEDPHSRFFGNEAPQQVPELLDAMCDSFVAVRDCAKRDLLANKPEKVV